MTARQAPRRNPHLGTDCPPWCTIDHANQYGHACIGGGGGIERGHIWTRAIRNCDGFEVGVTGLGPADDDTQHLSLDPRAAEQLAGLVDLLTDGTPEEHRELAAAIRKAVAEISDGGQA